jgi:hypothetical protein
MNRALYVEGPSDKVIVRRILAVLGLQTVPVRAGHAHYQGDALLSRWRLVAALSDRDKLLFVFDAGKAGGIQKILAGAPEAVTGRRVVLLAAPWKGIEDFMSRHLEDRALEEYESARSDPVSKRILAESFAGRVDEGRVRANSWIAETLLPCVECRCPAGATIA